MQKPKISIIVAVSRNLAIGKANRLLFNLPDDLKRFKRITRGHAVVMGQKTFESIGKPLPERANIIVTDMPDYKAAGTIVTHSIEEALKTAREKEKEEVFICGGGMIYRQFFPLASRLYVTVVEIEADGDTFFPDWSKDFTREISREEHIDEKTGLKYSWIDLERKKDV